MPPVTAFVPIRLNSSRLPGKSIRLLNGLPLAHYALNALLRTPEIDRVCVFCSDPGIAAYLPEGVEVVIRPQSLDQDTTLGIEIYQSFLSLVDSDFYLLAHVTSPFLRPETLGAAVRAVRSGTHDSALTVRPVQTFCWYQGRPLNYELTHVKRTQDLEPVYAETSACFLFPRALMAEQGRRVGDRPHFMVTDFPESLDIDTESDFLHAEVFLQSQNAEDTAAGQGASV
jgi:CMP-N-acetylneuraminic acid synthetase